jgi:hypothetical protein
MFARAIRLFLCTILLVAISTYTFASQGIIRSSANLLPTPSAAKKPLQKLAVADEVEILDETRKTAWNGNGGDPDTYLHKNRSDIPSAYHDVKWEAIHDLPFPDDKPLRKNWSPENIADIERYEGVAVRTIGHIVAVKPQAGNEEGTNCCFSKVSETDIHIAIVGEAGDGERNSVVVETTPRFLKGHPKWTKKTLDQYSNQDIPVRISGWLMFDPDHRAHLNKYRHTLWEIHPITAIEVMDNGQWKRLSCNSHRPQNSTSQSHLRDASRLRIVYWSLSRHSPSKASPCISLVAVVKLTDEPQFRQLL